MRKRLRIKGFDSTGNGVVSPKNKYEKLSLVIKLSSVVIALATLYILWDWNYGSGKVEPLRPSGYFVVRGIKHYEHPSDHIVLPIEWKNSGGKEVVVTNIKINLIDSTNIGNNYVFLLAGKYNDRLFKNYGTYEIIKNLIIKPHSISPTILIFHIDGWWNEKNREKYEFRFKSGEKYKVVISFEKDLCGKASETILEMEIYPSIENLQIYGKDGKPFWDYWDRPVKTQK